MSIYLYILHIYIIYIVYIYIHITILNIYIYTHITILNIYIYIHITMGIYITSKLAIVVPKTPKPHPQNRTQPMR